jgi:hypothetical protein
MGFAGGRAGAAAGDGGRAGAVLAGETVLRKAKSRVCYGRMNMKSVSGSQLSATKRSSD